MSFIYYTLVGGCTFASYPPVAEFATPRLRRLRNRCYKHGAMPSPIGHALAGVTIAFVAQPRHVLLCVFAAMAADLDILWGAHRTWTHSLGATAGVAAIAFAIARARRSAAFPIALAIAAAYGSHLLLDWLGRDSRPPQGIMLWWPVSTTYYVSGLDIFTEISRRYWLPEQLIVGNLKSIAREVVILGPLAFLAWWSRKRGPA